MHRSNLSDSYNCHVQVHIKKETAVVTGVVESKQQKQKVITTIAELDGVSKIKNYLCVIAPFNPLSKWIKKAQPFDVEQDVLVTITQFQHDEDPYGHVVFHDTLNHAKSFIHNNNSYVNTN